MYGGATPLEALLSIAYYDGVPSRGHRDNIFMDNYYYTGVGVAMHTTYGHETVTTFSGAYSPDTSYQSPDISIP